MKTLVTAQDVKDLTQVSPNADDVTLAKAVPDAQTQHLRPLLGVALFEQLLAFVAGAPTPPSLTVGSPTQREQAQATYAAALSTWQQAQDGAALLALWQQLKSALAQWVLVDAWPALLVHIDAAGVVQRTGNSQGTTQGDVATVNLVLSAHRATAIWRSEELVRWLEKHKADYPTYGDPCPVPTAQTPLNFFGGIQLD